MCPLHVRDKWPQEHVTPMGTVLKAIDKFLDNDEMTGQVVELSLEHVHFRELHRATRQIIHSSIARFIGQI